MKTRTWSIVLLAAMILLWGCQQKRIVSSGGDVDYRDCISRSSALDNSCFGSVQIVMFSDTLRILPDDSTWMEGFVVVKDDAGRVMPLVWVCLDLDQDFGWIEFTDTLRNTSDTQGRVYFRFGTYGVIGPGYQTIHAWVGNKEDRWTMWLQPVLPPFRLNISASKDPLRAVLPHEDSTRVTVTLTDSSGGGISGVSISLRTNGGRLAALPATDAAGYARTQWWTNGSPPGVYFIVAQRASLTDTAWVHLTIPG